MKKFLLSFVMLLLTATSMFAQRDREHWIAPFFDSSSTVYNKALYFSTDSTTPFEVKIYSNNIQIGAVTIALNNPQVFFLPQNTTTDPDVDPVEMSNNNQAYTAINKGIYTSGPKEYFLTLRIYNGSHGEILTSKGKAGLGTTFYAAPAPTTTTTGGYNFTAAVLATEDNTSVTVTGFNAGVVFINQPATTNTITFTLNKGQSYILAGTSTSSGNSTGFIGAKIVSTKPITLTNGNSNGFYATSGGVDGSDLILDQSVPADRLGKEFAMIRTLGALNTGYNMEGGMIVATENNTEIFLNNGGSPVATINEGEFYRILDADYVQQGTSTHYNIFVRASKNVYLYQFVSGNSNARNNGGYNYIPPLNCFLPKKIEQIGKVNEMPISVPAPPNPNNPPVSGQPTSTFLLKLNIITEAGATVLVNNVAPTAAEGPYPLSGNSQWVTYAISGVQGNLTITSTKAVTAGVNGGYSTAGYGGYFAGFSSVPLISKVTGVCIPGIILEVPDNFDTYQWYLNGVAIPGATSNTYTPTVAGNYTVNVTVGTCPGVTTPVFKVFKCLQETNTTLVICGIKTITPAFTSSTQTIVPGTVQILTPPSSGTAVVNPTTGVITYTPQAGFLGTVTMVYQFCGNATEFIDCEKVTLTLQVVPFIVTDRTIFACQYDGKAYFDLTSANVTDTTVPFVRKYYPTLADLNAGTNEITNPTVYFSGEGFIYVKVTTSEGCEATAKITLKFYPSPIVNDATISQCFLEINETQAKFDLNTAVVTSQSPITKRFYPTFTDANNGTNEILANLAANYFSTDATVYVRVYSAQGCYSIAKITLKVIPPKRSAQLVDKFICIDDRTTLDAGPGYQSYTWSTGATTQSIQGVPVGEYWVLLKDNGCSVKQFVKVKKIQDPVITSVEISNNTATVIATGGTAPYQYSIDGLNNWQTSNVFTNLTRGQHTFFVKDSYNCAPVSTEITVPNLINAITPNGDNKNDYIDYRELAYKENLTFTIYDRYGNKIFMGDKFNNFRWDGKHFDKKILTGTYWYHISWNEPNAQKTPVKYTGWILVKNRE
ncbi:gliding motility protein [Chryseobacterium sp. Leaf180]|uniref:T9SS type B sorting domain-containing protein n=1 Tax=Chryseobacterium sp. Leaf180 TaxID=1736289 RepID=UPI000701CFFC|nr:gliding motility-associated C-terminal domain-containing protein [Chryseobacterium sp. Leaf180]KQR93873.1 gliding motility protein [Chryseobacterium sp. Leaf180]